MTYADEFAPGGHEWAKEERRVSFDLEAAEQRQRERKALSTAFDWERSVEKWERAEADLSAALERIRELEAENGLEILAELARANDRAASLESDLARVERRMSAPPRFVCPAGHVWFRHKKGDQCPYCYPMSGGESKMKNRIYALTRALLRRVVRWVDPDITAVKV